MPERTRRLAVASLLLASLDSVADFHLWQMRELFSNGGGSVQYLELTALSGGQQFLAGHALASASGGPANTFNFPSNLPGDTTGRTFLVGTQGFAALGLVTPDYVVPNGFFFGAGGTINFASGADTWNHGALPTAALSLARSGPPTLNSPKNFAGAASTLRFGALDPTFGTGGIAPFAGHSVAVQADGRIVALGGVAVSSMFATYTVNFQLRRLTAAGALDFVVSPQVDGCGFCSAATATTAATLLQPDGRIVSVGATEFSSQNTGACKTVSYVAMRNLAASGSLDATFDGGGVARLGGGEARGMALQADGKIVVAGSKKNYGCLTADQPMDTQVVRFNADGGADATFGTSGSVITQLGTADDMAHAVAVHPDGRIVVAGYATNGTQKDFSVVRYTSAGAVEAASLHDVSAGADDVAYALALQDDGKILAAGSSGSRSAIVRLAAPATLDAGFASAGKFLMPGAAVRGLALQADGKILALTEDGDVLRLQANGLLDTAFGIGGRFATGAVDARSIALQPDGKILVGTTTSIARIDPQALAPITPDAAILDFGAVAPTMTSPVRALRLTNTSGAPQSVASVTAAVNFSATHDCTTLAAGASCTVSLAYAPAAEGSHDGDLVIVGSAGVLKVFLVGNGERSLVTHYYRSILRREPDAGGKAFWDAEAARVTGLGANVNEVWFAMAMQFYFSAEYAAFNRNNSDFVTDLYNTFFNRPPDAGGLAHWLANLSQGMPREVLLAEFMFSAEFRNFTQAIFGGLTVRPEIDAVTDFYRGLLARLPDSGGFDFWLGRFRAAQCQGQAQVVSAVEAISSQFALSPEYAGRARTNVQYVGDLYNAFLRRGGDLPGVLFWIGRLNAGALTREQLRVEFKNSPEFQGRVNAILAQSCLP